MKKNYLIIKPVFVTVFPSGPATTTDQVLPDGKSLLIGMLHTIFVSVSEIMEPD